MNATPVTPTTTDKVGVLEVIYEGTDAYGWDRFTVKMDPSAVRSLAFKTEDFADGQQVGPVWFVTDDDMIPFGFERAPDSDWEHASWTTWKSAANVAQALGIEITEA